MNHNPMIPVLFDDQKILIDSKGIDGNGNHSPSPFDIVQTLVKGDFTVPKPTDKKEI